MLGYQGSTLRFLVHLLLGLVDMRFSLPEYSVQFRRFTPNSYVSYTIVLAHGVR